MAKQASDANIRASLVEMAWEWLDLAELDEWDNWQKALRLRATQKALRLLAIQTKFGRELRAQYEPPEELPDPLLTLLAQLDVQQDGKGSRPCQGPRGFCGPKSD
jgi:hypothetical protein